MEEPGKLLQRLLKAHKKKSKVTLSQLGPLIGISKATLYRNMFDEEQSTLDDHLELLLEIHKRFKELDLKPVYIALEKRAGKDVHPNPYRNKVLHMDSSYTVAVVVHIPVSPKWGGLHMDKELEREMAQVAVEYNERRFRENQVNMLSDVAEPQGDYGRSKDDKPDLN